MINESYLVKFLLPLILDKLSRCESFLQSAVEVLALIVIG